MDDDLNDFYNRDCAFDDNTVKLLECELLPHLTVDPFWMQIASSDDQKIVITYDLGSAMLTCKAMGRKVFEVMFFAEPGKYGRIVFAFGFCRKMPAATFNAAYVWKDPSGTLKTRVLGCVLRCKLEPEDVTDFAYDASLAYESLNEAAREFTEKAFAKLSVTEWPKLLHTTRKQRWDIEDIPLCGPTRSVAFVESIWD